MKLDLSSACMKLDRALVHLTQLGDLMEAMGREAAANLSVADEEVEPRDLGFRHIFRPGRLIYPSPDTGLVVGDYVQNLRSTLDHLAWEMVRCGTQPRHNPRLVQFPIYTVGRSAKRNRHTFATRVEFNLPGVRLEQRAFVEQYQPYHRGKWHLGALAELSNNDKHRVITPVFLLAGSLTRRHLQVTVGRIVRWRRLVPEGGRVDGQTPYLEVVVDSPDAEVIMLSTLRTVVAFPERPGRHRSVAGLREIGEKVAEIVGGCAWNWGRREDSLFCGSWAQRARVAL
jgi:hypothetical protein